MTAVLDEPSDGRTPAREAPLHMKRVLLWIVLLSIVGCEGCVGDVLVELDGGLAGLDAGFDDAGFDDAGLDAGFDDAGFDDAGFDDAGFDDAGFDAGAACPFADNPPQPVPCEDDADFCDAIEDRFNPEADLLATWSYVDGDEFVVQIRFLAPPFRRIRALDVKILFAFEPANSVGPSIGDGVVFCGGDSCAAVGDLRYRLEQDSLSPPRSGYPPPVSAVEFLQGEPEPPFDRCWFSLGLQTGLLELRAPLGPNGEVPRYGVQVSGADDVDPPTNDVSWTGPPALIVSRNGTADDADDLVSICDLVCPP